MALRACPVTSAVAFVVVVVVVVVVVQNVVILVIMILLFFPLLCYCYFALLEWFPLVLEK